MQRIKNLVARLIATAMRGHDLIVTDDVNVIDVAFHRHVFEGYRSRHAVTDVVEACELVLIDLRRTADAGIKGMFR